MLSNIFAVNNIIEMKDIENTERILYVYSDYTSCHTIDMSTNKFRIKKRQIKNLEEDLANGIIKRYSDMKHRLRIDKFMSVSDKAIMEHAKKIIDYILDKCPEPNIYDRNQRGEVIKCAVNEFHVTKSTVYKYLRKYLQGGKTMFSLLPDYCNSGGKGKRKKLGNKKIGRPSYKSKVLENSDGVNVDDNIKQIFIKAIDKYYANEKETPLSEVHRLMIQEYFSRTVIENGKEVKKAYSHNEIPNMQQFRYWCKNLEDVIEIMKKRKGEKYFSNNYRGLSSNSSYEAFGPLFRAQIDSTVCPVEILNRMLNKNIGKPTVYHITDEFSTFILGLNVGIGKASWNGASLAILNCIENKVEFCRKYGLEIEESQWPTAKLPRVLLTDRGTEYTGNLANYISENLGMVIQNAPPGMPSYKGIVEQSFNTSEIKLRTWLPGIARKGGRKRGDKDPKNEAKLDIKAITYAYLAIAVHYNNRTIPDHPYAGELIKEGIIPTPINLYLWGLKRFSGGLHDYDKDFVKLNLFRRGTATVDEKGIRFKGAYYTCDRAIKESWYTKARIGKSWRINICYDGNDMDYIYFINDGMSYLEKCTIKEEYGFYKGRTIEEIDDYENVKKINETSLYTDHDNQNDLDANERLKAITDNSIKKAGGNKKNSNEMKKNIKENAHVEKKSYGKLQAMGLSEAQEQDYESSWETNGKNDSYLSNKIDSFRRGVGDND